MKLKNLRKKVRRLEKRLREGPKKLAKLKRKLEAMEALKTTEARKESAARARADGRTDGSPTPIKKKHPVKTAAAKKPSAVPKAKRKLTLSPERRAQLAAAMKARWAAKRAQAQADHQMESTAQGFTLQPTPQVQAPENMPGSF